MNVLVCRPSDDVPPVDCELHLAGPAMATGRRSGLFKHVQAGELLRIKNPLPEPKAVS